MLVVQAGEVVISGFVCDRDDIPDAFEDFRLLGRSGDLPEPIVPVELFSELFLPVDAVLPQLKQIHVEPIQPNPTAVDRLLVASAIGLQKRVRLAGAERSAARLLSPTRASAGQVDNGCK